MRLGGSFFSRNRRPGKSSGVLRRPCYRDFRAKPGVRSASILAHDDAESNRSIRRRIRADATHGAAAPDGGDITPLLPDDIETVESSEIRRQPSRVVVKHVSASDVEAKRIYDERDVYWEKKREEMGADFDEEEVMKEYAKAQLLLATSNAELLQTAELLIEEDWLGQVDAVPGNIYRLVIMGDVFVAGTGNFLTDVQNIAKIIGVAIIVAVQFAGPPLIFLSRFAGIGVLKANGYVWSCCPWHPDFDAMSEQACNYNKTLPRDVTYFDDWHHISTTKTLGVLMMIAFILNGLFVILDEKQSWRQIYTTFHYLDVKNARFKLQNMWVFIVDAFINTWVICWCAVDVFLVLGAASTPQDVLMNSLGLLFLYNLDDVGGDLGFVNEDDWPGLRLAWIYKDLVHSDDGFDEEKFDCIGWFVYLMYSTAILFLTLFLFVVPVLAIFTPFIQFT